jgi:hypothetical protein
VDDLRRLVQDLRARGVKPSVIATSDLIRRAAVNVAKGQLGPSLSRARVSQLAKEPARLSPETKDVDLIQLWCTLLKLDQVFIEETIFWLLITRGFMADWLPAGQEKREALTGERR